MNLKGLTFNIDNRSLEEKLNAAIEILKNEIEPYEPTFLMSYKQWNDWESKGWIIDGQIIWSKVGKFE